MNQDQTAKTLGDWAYIAIAKHDQKILQHESLVLKDRDPENLHQMRVGMRRLRSAIAGFAPALDLPLSASEKNLAKIARVLGKLRDIDVLQEILITRYQPNLPENEVKNFQVVLKALKKRRKPAFKAVKQVLHSRQYVQLKTALEAWLESPTYQAIAKVQIQRVLPDLLLPQACSFLLHPGWLVGMEITEGEINFEPKHGHQAITSAEAKVLHSLRKSAKKTRYNMELFTSFYGNLYDDYLQRIKDIQEVLGQIQDSAVLLEFLASLSDDKPEIYLPSLVQMIQENRLNKLEKWQVLQEYFLHHRRQQELRAILQYPA
ncbi:MAG TPA: CHAD domain-containing protein [Xenococcaceae cyanobacterium]|jgi:CHAD domain-containing protein